MMLLDPILVLKLMNNIKNNIHKKNINFVIPYLNIDSTLKKKIGKKVKTQIEKHLLQHKLLKLLNFLKYLELYSFKDKITDDAQLVELYNVSSGKYIEGEIDNIKITNKDDLELFKKLNTHNISFKVGNGFDVHRLVPGDGIMLGGDKD